MLCSNRQPTVLQPGLYDPHSTVALRQLWSSEAQDMHRRMMRYFRCLAQSRYHAYKVAGINERPLLFMLSKHKYCSCINKKCTPRFNKMREFMKSFCSRQNTVAAYDPSCIYTCIGYVIIVHIIMSFRHRKSAAFLFR